MNIDLFSTIIFEIMENIEKLYNSREIMIS